MANKGFTLVEMLVVVAVLAILSALAIPSFTGLINRERVGSAADGFVRALDQTKAHAIQTGRRTQLLMNSSETTNCGNQNVAWAIVEEEAFGKTTAAVSCLTKVDFGKRFGGATFSAVAESSITVNPLGIANNNAKISYTLASKERSKVVDVYPGGTVKLQQCQDLNKGGIAALDC